MKGSDSLPCHISVFFLQFWDDSWRWGEPLSQDGRQHYVSNSGWEQRRLLLVHLQPPVSQPLPRVGPSAAFSAFSFSLTCAWAPTSETRVVCCVHQNQPGFLSGGWAQANRSVQVPRKAPWTVVWRRHAVQVAVWFQGQIVQPWFCQGETFLITFALI